MEFGFRISDFESWILEFGVCISDLGSWILEAKFGFSDIVWILHKVLWHDATCGNRRREKLHQKLDTVNFHDCSTQDGKSHGLYRYEFYQGDGSKMLKSDVKS